MKNSRSGEKIKLTSIDELLGVVNEESAMEIEIKTISPFKGHPFKVIADDKMEELINSVKESGVITPVLLRPAGENHYEMISGHRRMYAARKAGLSTMRNEEGTGGTTVEGRGHGNLWSFFPRGTARWCRAQNREMKSEKSNNPNLPQR